MSRLEHLVLLAAVVLSAGGEARAQEGDPSAAPMPAGHPDVAAGSPHAGGGAGGGGIPGVFNPPEDVEEEAPNLAPGTISVELHDADDRPVANETVTLGMIINSIAKGDSRKHVQGTTDAQGRAVFRGLDTASNIAYRVSTGYQGGAFAAAPFQLGQVKAMRVVLHVYSVTGDIQQALIVAESTVAAEMRDDRIQMEEVLNIYNLGRVAWQPDDVVMKMPAGTTAFSSQANMNNQSVDEADERAKLHGTFAPGRHTIDFRWQIPWAGEANVDIDVGLPPHVAIARVMMPATTSIKLAVSGFLAPEIRHNQQGESFLVAEKRIRPDEPRLTSLAISILDLPVAGPGRMIATSVASCVVVGLVFAFARRKPERSQGADKTAQDAILEELAELERAHASGEIGPKTYERARRELVDALARTLVLRETLKAGGNVQASLGVPGGAV